MPKLRQVLDRELEGGRVLHSLPRALLECDVIEVLLATGAPCDSHAGAFRAWPGAEPDVARWFRLENGSAVGIRYRGDAPHGLALWEQERDG